MDWNIRQAQEQFSELVRDAAAQPQKIYRQDRLVAAVVDPAMLEEFLTWQRQREGRHAALADAIAKLPRLLGHEKAFASPRS